MLRKIQNIILNVILKISELIDPTLGVCSNDKQLLIIVLLFLFLTIVAGIYVMKHVF